MRMTRKARCPSAGGAWARKETVAERARTTANRTRREIEWRVIVVTSTRENSKPTSSQARAKADAARQPVRATCTSAHYARSRGAEHQLFCYCYDSIPFPAEIDGK